MPMALTLQQLTDIEAIKTVKHRYFRAIDTADAATLDTLFSQDVVVDFRGGAYRIKIEGKADYLKFLANSFHSGAVAMHHGNMPEITLTGDNTAEGVWSLFDIFINAEAKSQTFGSAIYRDQYRREEDGWKISRTEYDRIIELVSPLEASTSIIVRYLANVGLKPDEREDISHLISWTGNT